MRTMIIQTLIIAIVASLGSLILVYATTKFEDAKGVKLTTKGVSGVSMWSLIYSLLIVLFTGSEYEKIVFTLLLIYFTVMAYTDIQTKSVWPVYSYIVTVFGIITIISGIIYDRLNLEFTLIFLGCFSVILLIMKLLKAFGTGDLRILFAEASVIYGLKGFDSTFIGILLQLLVACIGFLLVRAMEKRYDTKERCAFAQYLALGSIIFLLV